MIWAIGDIQGCYSALKELLKKIEFDLNRDKLWIAGDLINRGEDSLSTILYLYSIRDRIEVVLGNHDIALIASYYGLKKSNSSIEPILKHPKIKDLIDWLRSQKFLHIDRELGYCMVHAGIAPSFDLGMATMEAHTLEDSLSGNNAKEWLNTMLDDNSNRLDSQEYALSSFIRMRFCDDNQTLDFKQKCSPDSLPKDKLNLKPWFNCHSRKDIDLKIIFGHWSTLGLYNINNRVIGLDTGCVWGGRLTAMRIDNGSEEIVQIDCTNNNY
ncbi:MAG: symmetrical bis(5'-nucleosyl)-tetraphosphatase [Sulfurovum sp.]|nr:symmetrical bis(5'-nucleosyl)-tetraphosphatase [Sulfurovaceae bacterium]